MANSTRLFLSSTLVLSLALCCSVSTVTGQSTGDLRLVSNDGSTDVSSGRLQVYANFQWGTVCDDSFAQTEADVACRQLGFTSASLYGNSLGFNLATSGTNIWLDDVSCTGSESRLIDCFHRGIGIQNCGHSEDVGLFCIGASTSTPSTVVLGPTGAVQGGLRLNTDGVTYPRTYSGRLEIYINGQWGTVCDDSFGSTDARVACRQLGYEDYLYYGNVATVGYSGASTFVPTWLDNVACSSSDTSLIDCIHNTIGVEDCSHSEDVALVCLGTGSLRLITGFTTSSVGNSGGRLEIYINREWGTVCDGSFGSSEAEVACRQLGYRAVTRFGSVGSLGYLQASSFVQTWLDDLSCETFDTTLLDCSHSGIGIENCAHSEDIALICSSTSTTNPGSGSSSSFSITGTVVGILFGVGALTFVIICIVVVISALSRSATRTRYTRSFALAGTTNVQPVSATVVTTTTDTTFPTAPYSSYSHEPQKPPPAYQPLPDAKFTQQAPPSYPATTTPYPAQPSGTEPPGAYPPVDQTGVYPPPDQTSYPPAVSAYPPVDPSGPQTSYPPADSAYPPVDPSGPQTSYPPADSALYPPVDPSDPQTSYPPADSAYPPVDPSGPPPDQSGQVYLPQY